MAETRNESPVSGPGRRKRLSGLETAAVVSLLLLTGGIFCYALFMAAANRVREFVLDPYADLVIEGADGYGRASAVFDRETFKKDLLETMRAGRSGLAEEEMEELADRVSESVVSSFSEETEISNGDEVILELTVSEEAQTLLREKGFVIAFDCNPLVRTAEGLPEAEPYDPFEDLTVEFSGFDGAGRISIQYTGAYPFLFSASPEEAFHNGDRVTVAGEFGPDYDLERFVNEYHLVPTDMDRSYVVSGLLIDPVSINDFTAENLQEITERARTAALILLQEEYNQDEEVIRAENAATYFASEKGERTPETGQRDNCLISVFRIEYTDDDGNSLEYFYYIRYDDLALDEEGRIVADYTRVIHPEKSTNPLEMLLQEGDDVPLPGILNFRTLAGFQTLERLYEAVVAPLEESHEISSLIQP